MAKRPGQVTGFTKGLTVAAKIAEATNLAFILKIKEEKLYKEEGYASWDAYCKGVYGITRQTMDEKLQTIKTLGLEATKIMLSLAMRPQQLALLLTDEQKKGLKRGVLNVGDREIEVREENADELQDAFNAVLKKAGKDRKALTRESELKDRRLAELTEIKDRYERLYPDDDLHWVRDNRPIHAHYWEACIEELRAFALNDRAVNNTEAHAYLQEVYDRITGNLFDLNEQYKKRTAGLSFIGGQK